MLHHPRSAGTTTLANKETNTCLLIQFREKSLLIFPLSRLLLNIGVKTEFKY